MGEAWGGHLSTGLDVGRQRQNRPTTAALARLERSRRAGIITRAPEAFSMPLDSSIGRRRQELVIESWGCEFALARCIRRYWPARASGASGGVSAWPARLPEVAGEVSEARVEPG